MAYTEVFVWGRDSHGQLSLSPVAKPHPLPHFCSFRLLITAISCGDRHSAFVDEAGRVYTLGSNERGRLGTGRRDVQFTTEANLVEGVSKVVAIACGGAHTVVADEAGHVFSWGDGAHGALGIGDVDCQWTPEAVLLPSHFHAKSVSAGARHTAFLCDDDVRRGLVLTCGEGSEGQLGYGGREKALRPAVVPELDEAQQIACGIAHTLILLANGTVVTTTKTGARTVGNFGNVRKIAAGRKSAVLTEEGSVYMWESGSAAKILIPRSAVDLALGEDFTAVIDCSSQVWTWGSNQSGELGLGDFVSRSVPTLVPALHSKKVRTLACGKDFVMALGRDVRSRGLSSTISLSIGEITSTRATPRINSTMAFDPLTSMPSSTRNTKPTSGRSEEAKESPYWERRANEVIRLLAEEKGKRLVMEEEIQQLKRERVCSAGVEAKEREISTLQTLLEECRVDLAEKSQEIRQLSQDMETQTSQLRTRAAQEEQAKHELESALRNLSAQLRDSEAALVAAKTDIKRLKSDLEKVNISRNSEGALAKENEIRLLKQELEEEHQASVAKDAEIERIHSLLSAETHKYAFLEGHAEEVAKENIDLRQKCQDMEVTVSEFRATSTAYNEESGDLQDQLTRVRRELRLTKETLQRAEEHNRQLLEALERRSLTKAREYREKSLTVLRTPSPLQGRTKSPIPVLSGLNLLKSLDPSQLLPALRDENEGRPGEKTDKTPRVALKEQDGNCLFAAPPTFRQLPTDVL